MVRSGQRRTSATADCGSGSSQTDRSGYRWNQSVAVAAVTGGLSRPRWRRFPVISVGCSGRVRAVLAADHRPRAGPIAVVDDRRGDRLLEDERSHDGDEPEIQDDTQAK